MGMRANGADDGTGDDGDGDANENGKRDTYFATLSHFSKQIATPWNISNYYPEKESNGTLFALVCEIKNLIIDLFLSLVGL